MDDSQGAVLADPAAAATTLAEASQSDLQAAIAVMGENMRVRSVTPLLPAPHVSEHLCVGSYTHGTVGVDDVGRIVGLVAVSHLQPEAPVEPATLTAVARHFVATSGAEGNYAHQNFFGGDDGESIGKWLKRHHLRFSSSLVMEFGKEPVVNTAPVPHAPKK
ncbi:elongation factor Ts [Strigomonas culicis]|nr:elongation factor Ts [Strigomonas culicis]|eukprot:EPY34702.1 elongation factor Ts [Strigomonas culicis]